MDREIKSNIHLVIKRCKIEDLEKLEISDYGGKFRVAWPICDVGVL